MAITRCIDRGLMAILCCDNNTITITYRYDNNNVMAVITLGRYMYDGNTVVVAITQYIYMLWHTVMVAIKQWGYRCDGNMMVALTRY